jgi:hypothetical protein
MQGRTLNSIKSTAIVCFTNRVRHRALFAATHIVLVYGNWSKQNVLPECPGNNRVRFKASLQKFGSSYTDESQPTVAVTFNGQRFGECAPDGLLFSDPIAFDVAKSEAFFVRTATYVAGQKYYVTTALGCGGGTGPGTLGNGEGSIAGDYVDSPISGGAINTIGPFFDSYAPTGGPIAVLGFSSVPQKSCAIVGDSISAGLNDFGYLYGSPGGYLFRLLRNFQAQIITPALEQTTAANFPFVHVSQAGQLAGNFVVRGKSYKSMRLAELCTTVLWEYGVNDLLGGFTSLSQMQSNLFTATSFFTSRGKKFIACTLLPVTTSTDNFQTAGNQTVSAYETQRIQYNNWLRDATASGFVAQANAPGLVDYLDAALGIEVNPNGTPLALGVNNQQATSGASAGGCWAPAASTSIVASTVSGTPGQFGFTDNQAAVTGLTQDQYRGYCIRFTSGAAAGQTAVIAYHTAAPAVVFTFGNALNNAPSVGDSYVLYNPNTFATAATGQGVHPTSLGHMAIANYLASNGALAKVI